MGKFRRDVPAVSGIVMRVTRAALLDAQIYEEVEADRSATPQAFAIVVLTSLAEHAAGLRPQVGGRVDV